MRFEEEQVRNAFIFQGATSKIKAKDIRVYIEDGIPYIHYIGEFYSKYGKYEITIPKMSIDIESIVEDRDVKYDTLHGLISYPKISFSRNLYTVENYIFTLRCIEKAMTKEEIEKELGYKINIVYEDNE